MTFKRTPPRIRWPDGGRPQGGGGWGGGKPPPEALLLHVLTRRTEGRRILKPMAYFKLNGSEVRAWSAELKSDPFGLESLM